MLTVLICISNSSSTFSVPATPAEKSSAVAAAAPTKTVINVKQLFTQQEQLLHTMQKLHCFLFFRFYPIGSLPVSWPKVSHVFLLSGK
jgi:hypothetical protein